MSTRRLRFASREHQLRETHARHVHAGEGRWMTYGDGQVVLKVNNRPKRGGPICEVIGENGLNEWGEPFEYGDYFLPEEL